MPSKRTVRLTNTRIRLAVGVILAAMFCVQCSQSDGFRNASQVTAISGLTVGQRSSRQQAELERLAKTDHVALLRQALENYRKNYQDYTCTFVKAERINGQFRDAQEIQVKFLESPFSVAMRWVKNAPLGDRVLYVEGKYNGKMLVNPKGALILFTGGRAVTRDPEGEQVMANTRRPVTMFGFRRSMENLLKIYELAAGRGEGKISFEGYRGKGRKVMILKRVLPPRKDYPAKTTVWYLDVDHLVPVGLEADDWDGRKICSYLYKDVKFNVGLGDDDFTPEANGMKVK